ncbi:LysR family transcriptional regulator [Vibrio coralliirubri]|uniref:LysR family transcriptional regulator n=1 Tax=Vibrio coralliirubri TaxID=1516159 RepID=UPI000EFA3A64|nr:LysR family transcriptional regulator [Vibrio coralliirubri]
MHTLEQLSAFIAVYEQGSYSQAAKILNKSRTTVREHVMAYEDMVGYPLFDIQGRKAVPSDQAKQLYPRAKTVERQNRDLYVQSQGLFENDVHTINLVYDVITPLALLTSIESKVQQTFPGVVVNWQHRTRERALKMLDNGEADIAIMPNRSSLYPEQPIAWKSIGDVELACFARSDSPLVREPNLTLNHLRLETQYITENMLTLDIASARISPVLHTVSNSDLLCELLKFGGWAVMPKHYMRHLVESGKVVELKLEELGRGGMFGLNVFFSHGKDNHPIFQQIIRWCVDYGRENNHLFE